MDKISNGLFTFYVLLVCNNPKKWFFSKKKLSFASKIHHIGFSTVLLKQVLDNPFISLIRSEFLIEKRSVSRELGEKAKKTNLTKTWGKNYQVPMNKFHSQFEWKHFHFMNLCTRHPINHFGFFRVKKLYVSFENVLLVFLGTQTDKLIWEIPMLSYDRDFLIYEGCWFIVKVRVCVCVIVCVCV